MDLDNLKKLAKEVKAPQSSGGGAAEASSGTNVLLQAIQANDERECRQTRQAFPLYLAAAMIFAVGGAAFFVGSSSGSPSRAIHMGMLATILMLVSILLLKKLHSIRAQDFSAPVHDVLAESEKRYRFIRPLDLWYSIQLLLVLAVTGGSSVIDSLIPRYFMETQRTTILTAYSCFFAVVCCMGFYFSYKNWKRDKGGIYQDIRRMREELESQPNGNNQQ
jgi:hypothetical protein